MANYTISKTNNGSIIISSAKHSYCLLRSSRQELIELRCATECKDFLILKLDNEMFGTRLLKKSKLTPEDLGCTHLCGTCSRMVRCPKTLDPLALIKAVNRVSDSKRIEKYSFITLGYESLEHLIVLKCDKYLPTTPRTN